MNGRGIQRDAARVVLDTHSAVDRAEERDARKIQCARQVNEGRIRGEHDIALTHEREGAPQVNADLLANRVQMYFGTLPTQIAYVRAGQMRAYGVASSERAPAAPELPTLAEQGLNGLNLDTWNALYVPAGTPKHIVQRLNTEVVRIINQPEVRKRIEATGSIVRPGTAEQLQRLTADEFAQYRKLAAEANIQLQ